MRSFIELPRTKQANPYTAFSQESFLREHLGIEDANQWKPAVIDQRWRRSIKIFSALGYPLTDAKIISSPKETITLSFYNSYVLLTLWKHAIGIDSEWVSTDEEDIIITFKKLIDAE